MNTRLYIGNWPFAADESTLKRLLEQHGKVVYVKIIRDRETGDSKGYAFCDMADVAGAAAAIKGLDGTTQGGRVIVVNEARPMKARESGCGR